MAINISYLRHEAPSASFLQSLHLLTACTSEAYLASVFLPTTRAAFVGSGYSGNHSHWFASRFQFHPEGERSCSQMMNSDK